MKKCTKTGILLLIPGIVLLQISAISALAKELRVVSSQYKSTFENWASAVQGLIRPVGPKDPQESQLANPLQIALSRFYQANRTCSFSVGDYPYGVAFEGKNIWVTNIGLRTVTKINASDEI